MRFISIIVYALLFYAGNACASSGIVAVVNDKPITIGELNRKVAIVAFLNEVNVAEIQKQAVRAQVLDHLIEERIIEEAAEGQEIKIPQEMLNLHLSRVAEQRNMNLTSFLKNAEKFGLTKQDLELSLRAQIMRTLLLAEEVDIDQIEVSDDAILAEFQIMREQQKMHADAKLQLAEIVVKNSAEARAQIEKLLEMLGSGADFLSLASELSIAPSKGTRGVIGWVQLSQLAPEVLTVLKNLPTGSVSKPLVQHENISIFKVIARREIPSSQLLSEQPNAQEKQQISQYLKAKEHYIKSKKYLNSITQAAFVEIK